MTEGRNPSVDEVEASPMVLLTRKPVIALVLVSFWVAGTLFMWFAATRSFRTADRLLRRPEPAFAQVLKPLGKPLERAVLRHVASQINAVYFHFYGLVQLALGIIVIALLWSHTPRDRTALALAVSMFVITLVLAAFVEPRVASFGSSIDFNPESASTRSFWILHGTYTGLDGFKLLAGIILLVRWVLMA
ncbi:MAG TPA: hypothetical protein VMI06_09135 [Terriglobia bacterium]|nr:hypothetical protein [Terriglobia bacterium]